MATVTQITNSTTSSGGDILSNGGQLGGTTTITGASGTIALDASGRIDSFYYITTTANTTVLLPASAKAGYRVAIASAVGSVGTITVRNSANTITIGSAISAGSVSNILRTATIETWATIGTQLTSTVNVAAFSTSSGVNGNGTLSIVALGLAAAPLAVSANAYSPTNDCYTVALKSKTATTITFETYDNRVGVLIGGLTATKVGNVAVDFVITY